MQYTIIGHTTELGNNFLLNDTDGAGLRKKYFPQNELKSTTDKDEIQINSQVKYSLITWYYGFKQDPS